MLAYRPWAYLYKLIIELIVILVKVMILYLLSTNINIKIYTSHSCKLLHDWKSVSIKKKKIIFYVSANTVSTKKYKT